MLAYLFNEGTVLEHMGFVFIMSLLRYTIIAGTAYLLFWVALGKRNHHRRILLKFPKPGRMVKEFLLSVSAFGIFAIAAAGTLLAYRAGWTYLYFDIAERGVAYFIFTFVFLIIVHDTYFYWIHRFMHIRPVFKYVHAWHHKSTNPSPWTAFSFHPLESIAELWFFPLLVLVMPIHFGVFLLFLVYLTVMNVIAHLGYEFYPSGFTKHPVLKWINTSTHHNMHHSRAVNHNFGFYLNFWDRIMGTNHPKYDDVFEEVKNRQKGSVEFPGDKSEADVEHPGIDLKNPTLQGTAR